MRGGEGLVEALRKRERKERWLERELDGVDLKGSLPDFGFLFFFSGGPPTPVVEAPTKRKTRKSEDEV